MPINNSIASLSSARVIAGSLLLTTIGYSVAGTVALLLEILPRDGIAGLPPDIDRLVNTVLTLAGLLAVVSSLPLRKALDGRVPPGETGLPSRMRNAIVGMALSESAGAMGLVTALLTGSLPIPMILWGAAIGGCILHFPTRRIVDDALESGR